MSQQELGADPGRVDFVRLQKSSNPVQQPAGRPFVATDGSAQAGPDALVTYESSREGALLHHPRVVPVDHAIVGIVDQVANGDTEYP